jgi:hypothetical protein
MVELLLRNSAMRMSDLKIVLARAAGFGGAPGFKLNFLQFLAHESEAPPEFLGFHPHHDSAVMTVHASFGTRFKVANQNRVLLATLGTCDIDGFVLEHQQISRAN